jgi:hypothetical protein
MNFALQLASGRVNGTTLNPAPNPAPSLAPDLPPNPAPNLAPAGVDADAVIATLVGGEVSSATRATIAKATTGVQAYALTLGSPEFQRR